MQLALTTLSQFRQCENMDITVSDIVNGQVTVWEMVAYIHKVFGPTLQAERERNAVFVEKRRSRSAELRLASNVPNSSSLHTHDNQSEQRQPKIAPKSAFNMIQKISNFGDHSNKSSANKIAVGRRADVRPSSAPPKIDIPGKSIFIYIKYFGIVITGCWFCLLRCKYEKGRPSNHSTSLFSKSYEN